MTLSLVSSVGPSTNTKKSFLKFLKCLCEPLLTPKMKIFPETTLLKLRELASSNAIPKTFRRDFCIAFFVNLTAPKKRIFYSTVIARIY